MNLSSYLQMPPAPLVTNNASSGMPQGLRTGVGPSTGAGLGFDFADVMARQLQRLAPQQRQTFAADVAEQATPDTHTQERRVAEDSHQTERTASHTSSDDEARVTDAHQDSDERDTHDASPAPRVRKTSARATDVDALLAGLMQGAPSTPALAQASEPAPAVVNVTDTPVAAESLVTMPAIDAGVLATPMQTQAVATPTALSTTASLQTVALSPHMRIITAPQAAPSPESLAAFAKSMGLDESAIQDLMAQQPAIPAVGALTPDTAGLAATAAPQAGVWVAGPHPTLTATSFDNAMATQLAAMNAATDPSMSQAPAAIATNAVVSGAGLAAATTTLSPQTAPTAMPGLTPADMAAIQQLQITVLPPVAAPVNTRSTPTSVMPSTIDMLSLFGSGADESDVSALLSRFSEEAGGDASSGQPSSSGDESNSFGNFGQTLANAKTAANGGTANTHATTAANMSEAYDQLSDKMATELAARMHKQLSDGEWKMKFALRPSNLGGVEIQLEMKDGKLDAVFRADNPLTRDLIQNSSQRLREALGNFGINAGQVNVGQGGGNAQQHNSGHAPQHAQVRDNSTSQVNGTSNVTDVASSRSKANASLLDLYA